MLTGYEYGFPTGEGTIWCIRRADAHRMLCGRRVGFVPAAQPEAPRLVHADCLRVMFGQGAPKQRRPQQPSGRCPVCRGEVPLAAGRMGSHGQWRTSAAGYRFQSDEPCLGVNLRPVVVAKRGGR